jgi:glutaconyl-CoA/methylmalonyl-CoA decarboxylase subunit gamma
MEQEAEPEKKKVVLGQPAAEAEEGETASAANVNTANALKAPLPGVVEKIYIISFLRNMLYGDSGTSCRRFR